MNYDASVTMNEDTYFDKKDNIANLLVNIILLCIVVGAISLAAGVAFRRLTRGVYCWRYFLVPFLVAPNGWIPFSSCRTFWVSQLREALLLALRTRQSIKVWPVLQVYWVTDFSTILRLKLGRFVRVLIDCVRG